MVHTDSQFCRSQGKTWLAFLEGHYSKPFWPFILFFLIQTSLSELGERAAERSPPKPLLFSQLLQLPGKGPGSVWEMGEVLGFGRTVMGVVSLFLEAGMGRNQPSLGLSPFSPVQGSITPTLFLSRYQRGHEPGLALGNKG